jgi:hypothetical protein
MSQQLITANEISENGIFHVRECTRILEDGKELSSSYHFSSNN